MQIESLQKFFASSPAVRLIRSPHAYWIVDFLHQQFKAAGQITIPHSQLCAELDGYLDGLAKSRLVGDEKFDSRDKADTYLSAWCSGSIGWLKRFIDEDSAEPCYQLTAEFEKALAFVEKASRESSFVGTESRLRSILEILGHVVAGVSQDPAVRLRELERQRVELEQEIARIKSSPDSARMNSTQVRERFALASQQLQQLKSEFRAVEDRFRSITRGVQQRVLAAESRADILQFALDSEDMLKHGDQGRSFFEFLKLLYSPESQDRIAELVQELGQIQELAGEQESLAQLRDMVPTLLAEAEKILRTTQHLSVTLRRLLDARSTRHHQELTEVLRDILGEAARRSENPPDDLGIEVEIELAIQSPMDRPFWSAVDPFDEVELAPVTVDLSEQKVALEQLASLERLDWQAMRRNISACTENETEISLDALIERYPIRAGVVEILGYLQIAYDDGHRIDRTQSVDIPARRTGRLGRALRIPNVVFLPRSSRSSSAKLSARQAARISS